MTSILYPTAGFFDSMAKPRILVIDDDAPTVQVLTVRLEHMGYEVIAALTGAEGLMAMARQQPDVVLLDISMPGMSGIEVLGRIRAAGANVPIIVVSAYADPALVDRSAQLGVVDYLTKPLDPTRLTQALAAACRRRSSGLESEPRI